MNELKRFIREENNHISAYLVLLEYLEERKEFEDMNEIGKEMVKFCNNPNISTFVWIKAHILYAKILVLNQDYTKAIFLLKCLAKVFPPMPYIEIPYTMYLQRATTYQELNHISSEVFQQPESCRIHKDFAPSYKT